MTLRARFDIAWNFLPAPTRKNLRGFIRYAREVATLEGTCIYFQDGDSGSVEMCEGPFAVGSGYAFYCSEPEFCDVILPSDRLTFSEEGFALAIILHELAHVHDYFQTRNEFGKLGHYDSESSAWGQAVKRASRAIPNTPMLIAIKTHAVSAMQEDIKRS